MKMGASFTSRSLGGIGRGVQSGGDLLGASEVMA